ncbi:hypothetical protein K7432_014855, partial [Basidiobolus ranarum]
MINGLAILDTPVNESLLSLQTPIAPNFQEIGLSDSSLLLSTDVPPFLDISLSLTSNYDPILYPDNYPYASSLELLMNLWILCMQANIQFKMMAKLISP